MDFSEPAEYYDLRDAIGAITGKYGCTYFAEPAAAGAPTTELWQDLAHAAVLVAVGEVRRSLLDECGHSFGLVVGRESRMK